MTQKLRIFVSATTRDLGSHRRAVAEWLRAQGHEPVVQDEFEIQPDFVTISRMLLEQLSACDGVVCLIGDHYGAEPKDFPDGEARRSYTQLEYELGRTLKRPVYLFFTTPECPRDNTPAVGDASDLQRAYRARLQQRNEIWYEFGSRERLLELLPKLSFRPAVGRPNNLPFDSIGSLFKGRDEFLDRLRRSLLDKPAHVTAVFSRQAIHGLGGVGKTRAAVEYGLRFAADYTALLFVTADSPSALTSNLANLCGAMVLNLPERDETNVNRQAAAALRWLERNPGWLLILDNVDTPEAAEEVEKLLTRLSAGHTVVTSRLANWGAEVEPLELDVLNEAPAAEFLLERTANKRRATSTDPQEAAHLASDLDGLALALEQAGAFVAKHRCSFADYRSRWRTQEEKVIEWHDVRAMKYPRSVATTWQTSADALTPDGRGLLNVLCWLAPDPIPLTMLTKLGTPNGSTPIDVETACADLAEYSLVKWTDGNTGVKAHRLVQDVTRYRLPEASRRNWLESALAMVNDFVEGDAEDVRAWKDVYDPACEHALAVTAHADRAGVAKPTSRLMNDFAMYLTARAEFGKAEPLYRLALAIDEANSGSTHPDVATRLNNLAELLKITNRHSEAEPLCARAVRIFESSYGAEHPNVATVLSNMAGFLEVAERYAEAELLYARVVDIFEKSYDRQHPNVATALNNWALLLRETNRHSDAEPLFRRALDIDKTYYGPDHPVVAADLNNLALLLRATNRHTEAELLMHQSLAIDEASYGSNHPVVATRLSNLAAFLNDNDQYTEAEPLIRRALTIDEASYGPNHPTVAIRLNNLAELLKVTCRYTEAEPLFRRALSINETSYGPNHPDVATNLNNLAVLLKLTDQYVEAEILYVRAVRIFIAFAQNTGHVHPHCDMALTNYANFLVDAFGMSQEQAVARIHEVLGLDSPLALDSEEQP